MDAQVQTVASSNNGAANPAGTTTPPAPGFSNMLDGMMAVTYRVVGGRRVIVNGPTAPDDKPAAPERQAPPRSDDAAMIRGYAQNSLRVIGSSSGSKSDSTGSIFDPISHYADRLQTVVNGLRSGESGSAAPATASQAVTYRVVGGRRVLVNGPTAPAANAPSQTKGDDKPAALERQDRHDGCCCGSAGGKNEYVVPKGNPPVNYQKNWRLFTAGQPPAATPAPMPSPGRPLPAPGTSQPAPVSKDESLRRNPAASGTATQVRTQITVWTAETSSLTQSRSVGGGTPPAKPAPAPAPTPPTATAPPMFVPRHEGMIRRM